jgi:hypothetical protein
VRGSGKQRSTVELLVRERQRRHVGQDRLDLGSDVAAPRGGHRPVQHRGGDVGRDVADALPAAQAAQGHPAAARNVQHR